MPKTTIIAPAASNGHDHGPDGRFRRGNVAARRHGLQAAGRRELSRRDKRTSRLLTRYLRWRADEGRELTPTQVPIGRRYCELERLVTDRYRVLIAEPANEKAHDLYLATVRVQVLVARELGETPASMLAFRQADPTAEAEAAKAAQAEIQRLYGPRPKALPAGRKR
jgi:hypothetical protein